MVITKHHYLVVGAWIATVVASQTRRRFHGSNLMHVCLTFMAAPYSSQLLGIHVLNHVLTKVSGMFYSEFYRNY